MENQTIHILLVRQVKIKGNTLTNCDILNTENVLHQEELLSHVETNRTNDTHTVCGVKVVNKALLLDRKPTNETQSSCFHTVLD